VNEAPVFLHLKVKFSETTPTPETKEAVSVNRHTAVAHYQGWIS
jgi:hypothetical protein